LPSKMVGRPGSLRPVFRTMTPLFACRRALLLPVAVATAATPAELRAALAQLPSQPLVQMEPVPRYDCDAEYEMWRTAWTPDWKVWCCQNKQRGCPSTTTATQTTSTSTPTSTTTTTSTTSSTTEDKEACEAFCKFDSINATCSARIAWAVSHTQVSCKAAHKLVLKQCKPCALCSMHLVSKIKECEAELQDEAGEGGEEKKPDANAVFMAKKFDAAPLVGAWPRPGAAGALALGSRAALLGAAAAAMAALAVGLRRRRRAADAALLVEVPLAPNEATE